MDDFEEIKPDFQQEEEEVDALWISEDVRSYIYETAKWTKFLSIVGFIFSILTALTAFGANAFLSTMPADSPLQKIGGAGITIAYLLLAAVQFYPSLQLYRFSLAANQSMLFADQANLSVAMSKLKSFFKFWGIVTIAFIACYLMMMIFVVVAGVAVAGHGAA